MCSASFQGFSYALDLLVSDLGGGPVFRGWDGAVPSILLCISARDALHVDLEVVSRSSEMSAFVEEKSNLDKRLITRERDLYLSMSADASY